jgi:polyphosphate kinase
MPAKARDKAEEPKPLKRKKYEKELEKLEVELVKMQEWIKETGYKLVVLFEGRDAAGKGGLIKTIAQSVNPRVCRVVALGTPTEKEKSQWYFQRYVAHLPAGGEMVLFDRSWYNRAGVERVMGFCTNAELEEFTRSCPEFERQLVRSKIHVLKYWLSISDEEQEKRFQDRMDDASKHWKLSPMDVEARARWALVGGERGRQAPRAAQLHHAPAGRGALPEGEAPQDQAAATAEEQRLQAPADERSTLCPHRLLN